MSVRFQRVSRYGCVFLLLLACMSLSALTGCNTIEGKVTVGAIGAMVGGGRTPSSDIEETCYFGVFDPMEQVPPTVLRVRIRGQASAMSFAKYASGWVPAAVIDSLGTHVEFDDDTAHISITKGDASAVANLQTGRRLIVFGPEGFREVPRDHRFVVVMGSNPNKFFEAIDDSVGIAAKASASQRNEGISKLLFTALAQTKKERARLAQLEKDVRGDAASQGGAK